MNPRTLPSHLHFAQIMNTSLSRISEYMIEFVIRYTHATGAFEIHVFEPEMTKPPSTSVAVVSIPAGSDP
jgi:hypothetical protein